MPKHQVIRDVGHSLLGVLRAEMSGARSKGKAYLAAPTAEFLRKNQPCLLLFLYDLRPSIRVAHEEKWELEEEIVDERGEAHIVKYGRPLHPPEASAPRSWGWRRSHRESWLRPERSDAPWLEAKKRSSCGHRERQDNPREAASLVRTPTTER